MQPQTAQYVAETRDQVRAYKTELDESIKRFGDNNNEHLLERINAAKGSLDDVEIGFLSILNEDRLPPRTLAEEAFILQNAINQLHNVAGPQVQQIREWSVTYGPNFVALP